MEIFKKRIEIVNAMSKTVIGITEKVKIIGIKEKEVIAKIDTGADSNSISLKLASELQLGPIIKTIRVKISNGYERRAVVKAKLRIKNRRIIALFNITDRSHLKYPVLIGKRTLKKGFLIDPSK